jgi:hypothetical protein
MKNLYDKTLHLLDSLLGVEGMKNYPWSLMFGLLIVSSMVRYLKYKHSL